VYCLDIVHSAHLDLIIRGVNDSEIRRKKIGLNFYVSNVCSLVLCMNDARLT
jgi:hypothetical protein